MRKSLLSVAVIAGACAIVTSPVFAINTGPIQTFTQTPFNLAEAYPCTVGTDLTQFGVTTPTTFSGTCDATPPLGAAPGVLCLKRGSNFALDVNCFAVIPSGQTGPCFVQAFEFTKEVPGSFKCPDVFGMPHFDASGNLIPYRYFQFGGGVRTWWALNFTQPGTRFILDVISVCRVDLTQGQTGQTGQTPSKPVQLPSSGPIGSPVLHRDRWIWRVVADVHTLRFLIELMHGSAVSTLEVPCIIAEDMYEALKNARQRLEDQIAGGDKAGIGNAIFDLEALIVSNCLFIEVLNPVVVFPGPKQFTDPAGFQPPSNLAQTVFFGDQGSAVAGIIDTIEHPCCCKLLVDLEWIAIHNGLTGQTPTLPVF